MIKRPSNTFLHQKLNPRVDHRKLQVGMDGTITTAMMWDPVVAGNWGL